MDEFTDTLPDGMPDASTLIDELRGTDDPDERAAILGRDPRLGLLAPIPVLAGWLGVKESTIYQARTRTRSDGTAVWPGADRVVLGRMMWTFASVALNRASSPGRGWNFRSEIRAGAR